MFANEILLLLAVSLPVATIVGINVYLAASGEVGTLLWPSS